MASDLSDRVFLVTGANTGIGLATVAALAARNATIVAACRSPERSEAALDAVRRETGNPRITLVALNLASLASVRAAADAIRSLGMPLHVMINNAGLAGFRGQTEDGFELTFGVNHLGHFLLTALLFPLLERSPAARCIHVASKAHYDAKAIHWDALTRKTQTLTGVREYQVSKLCNVLFSAELAKRSRGGGVTSMSLHPGVVASDIWRRVPWPLRTIIKRRMISNDEGALTSIHCAAAEGLESSSGLYFDRCAPRMPNPLADDDNLRAELWRRSETWSGTRFLAPVA